VGRAIAEAILATGKYEVKILSRKVQRRADLYLPFPAYPLTRPSQTPNSRPRSVLPLSQLTIPMSMPS
jgi:hypothetical protein